jgi:hypothetical protein
MCLRPFKMGFEEASERWPAQSLSYQLQKTRAYSGNLVTQLEEIANTLGRERKLSALLLYM